MDDAELAARYLDRLGLDAEPPSAAALVRLHRAHVERVPWETLWIQCCETWGTDPVVSARRIAETGRGGYCYHLNGAFSWLLAELGHDVRRHVGGVHGPEGPHAEDLANHLVLTVHSLSTDDHPEGVGYQRSGHDATRSTLGSESDLFQLVGDVFGVDVAGIPSATRREVWERADSAHRAFLADQAGRDG